MTIHVRDRGGGIPRRLMGTIFEYLYTTANPVVTSSHEVHVSLKSYLSCNMFCVFVIIICRSRRLKIRGVKDSSNFPLKSWGVHAFWTKLPGGPLFCVFLKLHFYLQDFLTLSPPVCIYGYYVEPKLGLMTTHYFLQLSFLTF